MNTIGIFFSLPKSLYLVVVLLVAAIPSLAQAKQRPLSDREIERMQEAAGNVLDRVKRSETDAARRADYEKSFVIAGVVALGAWLFTYRRFVSNGDKEALITTCILMSLIFTAIFLFFGLIAWLWGYSGDTARRDAAGLCALASIVTLVYRFSKM